MVRAQQSHPVKRGKPRKERECSGAGVRGKSKPRGKKMKKERKRSYRTRIKTMTAGDGDALDCCVLLTRLEQKEATGKKKDTPRGGKRNGPKVKRKHCFSSIQRRTKSYEPRQKKTSVVNQQAPEPKINQADALLAFPTPIIEPRKRRMASLNAEAVNSLLLYRDYSLSSSVHKKQRPIESLAKDSLTKATAVCIDKPNKQETKKIPRGEKQDPSERCKKQKRSKVKADNIDWLTLLTPTPRRQAGLTAATLLKLTSALYVNKRTRKTDSKPQSESRTTAVQNNLTREPDCDSGTPQTKISTHPKLEGHLHHGKQGTENPVHTAQLGSNAQRCCSLCKTGTLDPEGKWTGTSGEQVCHKHRRRCNSVTGLSLKPVKEEQVETEVSPCCCSKERCVEYFHRLALFLGEKNFEEPEDGSLSNVFHHYHHHHHHHHHHLQSPHSIAHPAAIPISPHAYTCFPGYYLHYRHPDTSPTSIPSIGLCPKGGKRPKLLPSTNPPLSGISHPVYCCTSVEACYGEPCRINGFSSYSGLIPTIPRRGCSFGNTDHTKCNYRIKREDYSSALNNHHSPSSIPISPNPRTLTGCPVPTVPPAGQSVPHVQTPLSDPSQPQPPLQVAKECPQTAKAPSGSRSGVRGTGGVSSAVRPLNRDKKQKLGSANIRGRVVAKQPKNDRQKATNGWRAVGLPFQKEVYTVGEEALVTRTCFEGVQRDGEVIWVRDTVLLRSGPRKKSLPYVAKISALWEDPETGEMMMSLFWYYRPEHTQAGRNPSLHCENEIFASRHQDVNSVACIEDRCYVLTLAQYCRFCALVKCRMEGVRESATSVLVPPAVGHVMPTHHCVPDDVDPELVFVCRHVYDFRYGRLLKNLQ
ncbi:bromo adjacent homology domain-containing 1 protein [Lampris incognitus]|uniref:bromo adjacent homology domain-containing 1 protein n=1 Tax=Lampris incognitus TaxID=2546036 RepID=UPI0024B5D2AA|nr:bromo adjacent homology domain-containing 1 protein [Lampris incognitus]